MTERPGDEDLAYRTAAIRVLRARRMRDARHKPPWRPLLSGAAAAPLLVVALWLERVAAPPVALPSTESGGSQRRAAELGSHRNEAENEQAAIPTLEETQSQSAPEARSLTPWLSVTPERNADIAAFRVLSAADNRFGLREGDLIISDCGESGRGPDADVSAALAQDYAACLVTERDGERRVLISMLDPPNPHDPASLPLS